MSLDANKGRIPDKVDTSKPVERFWNSRDDDLLNDEVQMVLFSDSIDDFHLTLPGDLVKELSKIISDNEAVFGKKLIDLCRSFREQGRQAGLRDGWEECCLSASGNGLIGAEESASLVDMNPYTTTKEV